MFLRSKSIPNPMRFYRTFLSSAAISFALVSSIPDVALAHGSSAQMVPMQETLKKFGAKVKWDGYTKTFTIIYNGAYVQVKPDTKTAMLNGQPVDLSVPVIFKNNQAMISTEFVNEVFQSGLDKTFAIESTPHPLNPLTGDEIKQAANIIKQTEHYKKGMRFSQISLREPDKELVWQSVIEGTSPDFERIACITLLDGPHVIEAQVNLAKNSLLNWTPVKNVHGMVLLDDFVTVQQAIENSPEYEAALKKRGISSAKEVVATPLTVGYFGGQDKLQEDLRLLKVVAYKNVGDGNYWAHPIENLVAVVDLTAKKVIKVEDQDVIPVPLTARPYDGRDQTRKKPKALDITEPDGKNYTITGHRIHWNNWDLQFGLDSRVGLTLTTVTFNDKGTKRKILYKGNLGGMIVPYGDPDIGWYFKAYFDSGDYGMGTLTSSIMPGKDAPENAVLLDATIADYNGDPLTIPRSIAVFERYAGPEYKHQELSPRPYNISTQRRELVLRWISTIGNYDYIFDWVFQENGVIGINAGATGIEAVKGVKSSTMSDPTAKEDTRFGTLVDHNIVGTTHQHIYNFRLDMDIDGEKNSLVQIDPYIGKNDRGGPRTSTMETRQRTIETETQATENFNPSTVRLISNQNKKNKVGNPVSYQIIPYAGGTHPVAKGANFSPDEWLFKRANFMDKQIWVTRYNPEEKFPDGKYPNRSSQDTGLGVFTKDNQNINNTDNVIWLTTGTTHITRSEEWPIMPTEWVNILLKPWNFFDETPTLYLNDHDD